MKSFVPSLSPSPCSRCRRRPLPSPTAVPVVDRTVVPAAAAQDGSPSPPTARRSSSRGPPRPPPPRHRRSRSSRSARPGPPRGRGPLPPASGGRDHLRSRGRRGLRDPRHHDRGCRLREIVALNLASGTVAWKLATDGEPGNLKATPTGLLAEVTKVTASTTPKTPPMVARSLVAISSAGSEVWSVSLD